MLKELLKHRIKEFTAVYLEPQSVEILKGSRRWRTWQIGSVERHAASDGEGVFDLLQRLNLRPRVRKGSALILLLPRLYYSCHREHYPLALGNQIDEALNFDWQENIFYEHQSTFHFFAPPVPLENQFSVAIFLLQNDVHKKCYQALNGSAFETFAIVPGALAHKALLPPLQEDRDSEAPLRILARPLTDTQMEVSRFFKGELLESSILGKSPYDTAIFAEHMRSAQVGRDEPSSLSIQVVLSPDEAVPELAQKFSQMGVPWEVQRVETSFIELWMRHFLQQDVVHTFERDLIFKPWEVPQAVWPIAAMILLFSLYAAFQVHSHDALQNDIRLQRQQVTAMEREWKPIEELQTRITKFEQDQKTLAEFSGRNIPLLDLMNFLSEVTPEDTWLNYLSLRDNRLMLRGESKSAIKYLSELSKLEGFSDVRFASPVTRNPASDMERFNLQLQIEPAKLRETLAALPKDGEEDAMSGEAGGAEMFPLDDHGGGQPVGLEPEAGVAAPVEAGDSSPKEP